MNKLKSLLSEDHNLLYTNFTNPDTMMEDKKGGKGKKDTDHSKKTKKGDGKNRDCTLI